MEEGEIAQNEQFHLFIRPSKTDVLWDHPWRPGGPILCPEHISKTMLAMVMKFHGWIDLIKGECSAHDPILLLA